MCTRTQLLAATRTNLTCSDLCVRTAAGLLVASVALAVTTHAAAQTSPPPLEFGRDIRPILSDHCFGCHGPDANKRKAGLRLDTEEGAQALLESGNRALVPHDLARSAIAARIASDDPNDIMPPPQLKRPLTDAQRALLLAWIESGGEYEPHWAFVAPLATDATSTLATPWERDALDRYVRSAHERSGLAPHAEASREVLLRRASLAITGLNPSPEEVDAFVADASTDANSDGSIDAYERRVDAMLASPRAAEHAAVAWLDLARYADSYGYQGDSECFTWPWRDWLLHSLDANTPYDALATAMVAGDLLPNTRVEDKIASAFNRLHRMTDEGGSISEEFRQEAIADRVATWSTTFMGLTLECARCHDHKYDPIPTREFYGVAAMFGAIDENGLKPYVVPTRAPPPFVRMPSTEQEARTQELSRAVEEAREALDAALRAHATAQSVDEVHTGALDGTPPAAHYSFETLVDGATTNSIDANAPATTDRKRPEQLGSVALTAGRVGNALACDGDGGLSLAGLSGFTRHDPFSCSMWIRPSETNARAALLHSCGFYTNDADTSGIELLLDNGRVRWSIVHLWPGSAASIELRQPLPLNAWTLVTATYDGSSRADGLRLFIDGRVGDTKVIRDELDGPIAVHTLELGSRSRDAGFRGGAIDELTVWRDALTPAEVARLAAREATAGDLDAHASTRATTQPRASLRAAERALAEHLETLPALVCMADSPHASPTYVLARGAYDQPLTNARVFPGAIEAVAPFDDALPRNRLGLARWMFDAQNPLTARVAVNRVWLQAFGRGLVETTENFGMQGAWPTQRELLDALAYDFQHGNETGTRAWDSKALLRRVVLSATFRQSSAAASEARASDPSNDSLARGPSVRLTAEMLRDCALQAAGLLVERLGGPSVRPSQPASLASEAGQNGDYHADIGEGAHRRSLYTVRKRTVPPPSMLVFDAGSREACQPRRGSTNTPLQALVLLNDPIFVECAQALARRVAAEIPFDAQQPDARVIRAFRLACARMPRAAEVAALSALMHTQTLEFETHPQSATQLIGVEDPALAALTLVCSTVFASDAFVVAR